MLQLLAIHPLAHMGQINGLPAGHAFATSRPCQQAAQLRLHHGGYLLQIIGHEQLESQCLQGVARQQGIGLAKLHMHRGLATAQHIVVHAGHVVVHQRIGMDQFGGTGRAQGRFLINHSMLRIAAISHGLAGRHHQQGTQPLAAIEHGVTHGLPQARRGISPDPALQRLLHPRQMGAAPNLQRRLIHAAHSCVQGCNVPPSRTRTCSCTASSRSRQKASSVAPRW